MMPNAKGKAMGAKWKPYNRHQYFSAVYAQGRALGRPRLWIAYVAVKAAAEGSRVWARRCLDILTTNQGGEA